MILSKLTQNNIAQPPKWLENNLMYLTIVGSYAYGVSEDLSDIDYYGFCIPPKASVFPHLTGDIPGFGTQKKRFEQWQQHHMEYKDRVYDMSVYSIVKYFHLVMENNPNMVDSLFTPVHCIAHQTETGVLVRDNRRLFLHKGSYHKFRGYAYSQLQRMKATKRENPKRQASIDEYGYDVKFAYHLVRLLLECEQILETHDLDLTLHKAFLKAIRAGEWSEERIIGFFGTKEKHLEKLYTESDLQHSPNEKAIKELLLNCLEIHYGSLGFMPKTDNAINEIIKVLQVGGHL